MAASERPGFAGAPVAPGLPGIWATALATSLVLGLLVVLLWIVFVNAFGWFWPADLWRLELADGRILVGAEAAQESTHDAAGERRERLQLKVGNRELTGADFVWVERDQIVSRERPANLVRVVRAEYGDAFGRVVAATATDGTTLEDPTPAALAAILAEGRTLRARRGSLHDEIASVRRPLTRAEEALDAVERSSRAATEAAAAELDGLRHRVDSLWTALEPRLTELEGELVELEARLAAGRLVLDAGSGRIETALGQVLEVLEPNRMGPLARLGHALLAGVRFLFTEPREANTEGGIFPALVGTVLMVLLMSLAVVPLGVITAVYMTEYAREGLMLRLATQAVNNLAGVPSIVFGMFGLAFFIYGVGGSLDRMFYADRLPTPTFGTGGILWGALTLALLTVPVVIVATEEGLAAVPRIVREGSLALGATKFETTYKVVLPAAAPGILTGMILAMARAAGEVAPLMIVGMEKLAPALPVDGQFPFVHLERKFMHLGFHIYDVGFQSPNVDATKPLVFATALLLIAVVTTMNLVAIGIRNHLRRKYAGSAV